MPECRNTGEKVSPASAFLPVVKKVNPTSTFPHHGQSGTASHGLVRQCPALFLSKVAGEKMID